MTEPPTQQDIERSTARAAEAWGEPRPHVTEHGFVHTSTRLDDGDYVTCETYGNGRDCVLHDRHRTLEGHPYGRIVVPSQADVEAAGRAVARETKRAVDVIAHEAIAIGATAGVPWMTRCALPRPIHLQVVARVEELVAYDEVEVRNAYRLILGDDNPLERGAAQEAARFHEPDTGGLGDECRVDGDGRCRRPDHYRLRA